MKTLGLLALILRAVTAFVVYGALGYQLERLVFDKSACSGKRGSDFLECLPFYPLYGFGAAILVVIDELLMNMTGTFVVDLAAKVALATGLMTLLECFGGLSSQRRGWSYKNDKADLAFCDGYCSLKTSAVWAMLSTLFFTLDPLKYIFHGLASASV